MGYSTGTRKVVMTRPGVFCPSGNSAIVFTWLLILITFADAQCIANNSELQDKPQLERPIAPLPATLENPSVNSIDDELKSRDKIAYDLRERSLFPGTYYQVRAKLKEWEQKHGLEITFSYDVVGQQYFDDVDLIGGIAHDASLSGRWLLFGEKHDRPGSLFFRVRTRGAVTPYAPADLSSETGLFWKTVDGFNDSGFQVPSMYFSQELRKRDLIFRYGQFSIDNFFDSHRYRNAKRFFLNQSIASNPAVNFPSYGAGLVIEWKPADRWQIVAGVSNIQSTDQNTEVDFGLDSSSLFQSIQAGHSFSGLGGRDADLKIMGWHSDSMADQEIPEGDGLSFTLSQDGIEKGEGYVFRYAYADGGSTSTDMILFAGYGRKVHSYDHAGVGFSAGRSSLTSRWQFMLETYYRWRVFKELMITPDLQLIYGEHLDRDTSFSVVAGLRIGVIF